MATKQPAMSLSDTPIDDVLSRAKGPRREEAIELLELHRTVSGAEPVVWAGRILGFGEYEYRYESGHGGTAPLLAFAPGAARHTIYLTADFTELWPDIVAELGPHKASKACLYLTRLTGVNQDALRMLLERSLEHTITHAHRRAKD